MFFQHIVVIFLNSQCFLLDLCWIAFFVNDYRLVMCFLLDFSINVVHNVFFVYFQCILRCVLRFVCFFFIFSLNLIKLYVFQYISMIFLNSQCFLLDLCWIAFSVNDYRLVLCFLFDLRRCSMFFCLILLIFVFSIWFSLIFIFFLWLALNVMFFIFWVF